MGATTTIPLSKLTTPQKGKKRTDLIDVMQIIQNEKDKQEKDKGGKKK